MLLMAHFTLPGAGVHNAIKMLAFHNVAYRFDILHAHIRSTLYISGLLHYAVYET